MLCRPPCVACLCRCQDLGVAGYCFLMKMAGSGEADMLHQGLDTPWVSGYGAGVLPPA